MEFTVTVRERRASADISAVVSGNADYTVYFDTDSEWDAFSVKTAKFAFRRNGQETMLDVSFSGRRCHMPLLTDFYHAVMQQLAVICGGFANRWRLLADRNGRLIAASDGRCIACKEV